MITTLEELNDVVNRVVNHIVYESTQQTTTGNWITGYDDISHLISEEDYLTYFDLIANELWGREEVIDLDSSNKSFDCVYGLDYCPNLEWVPGDSEGVFNMSQEEFESFECKEVAQPLSLTKLAEIGNNTLKHEFYLGLLPEHKKLLGFPKDLIGKKSESLDALISKAQRKMSSEVNSKKIIRSEFDRE